MTVNRKFEACREPLRMELPIIGRLEHKVYYPAVGIGGAEADPDYYILETSDGGLRVTNFAWDLGMLARGFKEHLKERVRDDTEGLGTFIIAEEFSPITLSFVSSEGEIEKYKTFYPLPTDHKLFGNLRKEFAEALYS